MARARTDWPVVDLATPLGDVSVTVTDGCRFCFVATKERPIVLRGRPFAGSVHFSYEGGEWVVARDRNRTEIVSVRRADSHDDPTPAQVRGVRDALLRAAQEWAARAREMLAAGLAAAVNNECAHAEDKIEELEAQIAVERHRIAAAERRLRT